MVKGTMKIKIPTNYAHSRSISPSAAALFSYKSDSKESKQLLKITEVTAVGTISNQKDIKNNNGKSLENSNPQTIDTCYLPLDHDSLEMQFTVAFCSESMNPHSCNDPVFMQAIRDLTAAYSELGGYEFLAKLYLDNIFSAKMLWRNGLADDIYVHMTPLRSDLPTLLSPEGKDYNELVKQVGMALAGQRKRIVIKVLAGGWLGDGQEVFPSQEFTQKSNEKTAKSKTLARINVKGETDIASMHPQKIGNAIRQIDSWYTGFSELKKALPIDPACVNKPEFKAYRLKDTKRDLYSLFENNLLGFIDELKDAKSIDDINVDIHFVIANLIRGGVFGGK